jgi:hypothetical protein
VDLDEVLAATLALVGPHLTERQRRLLFGAAARALGYGGVSRVARLAEASRPTVRRGAAELDQPADPRGRIRQHQGPKRLHERDPGLLEMLDRLVEPDTRGDPQSPLRRTLRAGNKSERTIEAYTDAVRFFADFLAANGHPLTLTAITKGPHRAVHRRPTRPLEAGHRPQPLPLPALVLHLGGG